tara:strand:- start:6287 stop:6853 length:567 start_codon:yes stop_codon:yes gene_type:complete
LLRNHISTYARGGVLWSYIGVKIFTLYAKYIGEKTLDKVLLFLLVTLTAIGASASEITWSYKSPAFHYGNGYSSHVLSAEQLQHNRKEELADAKRSETARIARELENTTLNKFVKNVESRIYATLSKQMVDAMFATCSSGCATTGTAAIEGSTITWVKDSTTGEITLTIIGDDGTTTISIPGAGEFYF